MKNQTIPAYRLILFLLIPYAVGYLFNLSLGIPYLGMFLFYILPLSMVGFWFWIGTRFAHSPWNGAVSILIANSFGLASLLLYLWQIFLVEESNRNIVLSILSQCYTMPLCLTTGTLAAAFEPNTDTTGIVTAVLMQVFSFLFAAALLIGGYCYETRKQKKSHRLR